MRRKKYCRFLIVFVFLIATASETPCAAQGSPGTKEPFQLSPPGTIQIPPPPEYKPMPVQPAPSTNPVQPKQKGVLNPKTGEFYPSVNEGVYNPRTGEYYPPTSGGYFNPRTGEFYPSQDSGEFK
jgi:hypothetical protein